MTTGLPPILTPAHFGLPAQFNEWRPGQLDSIEQIYQSEARFQGLCAPTGFGKSLAYQAAAKMLGYRTAVLTSTKGLQDQLTRDFGEISYDLRGKGNFPCVRSDEFMLPPGTRVDEAPCQFGQRCELRSGGCEYFDRYRRAQQAPVVHTNYSCWFFDQAKEKGREGGLEKYKPFDLLVLDEAHDAPGCLAGYLETELGREECERVGAEWPAIGADERASVADWKQWAYLAGIPLVSEIEGAQEHLRAGGRLTQAQVRRLKRVTDLLAKLGRIAGISEGEQWIVEVDQEGEQVRLSPLWPARYAEGELFRGAKKVVLVSATVRPKTLALLGVPTDQINFQEYPSSFPVGRRPIYHVRSVQMRHNMTIEDQLEWLRKCDAVITGRPQRKGVWHTVSYKRAQWVVERSQHRDRLMIHGSNSYDRERVIAEFKASPPELGKVLVSPSVGTGYDFPGDQCRFNLIGKLPFPDLRSAVERARTENDKEYSLYMTAQDLQQTSGRGNRSAEDWCETFIVDDQVSWFVRKAKGYFSKWWLDAFRTVDMIPAAMQV